MFSVDLSTRECDGHVVVALGGELDLVDAAGAAAAAAARCSRRVVAPLRRPRRTGWPHGRTAELVTVKDGLVLASAARNVAGRDPAAVVPFPGCGDDR
jgi:hypothetical protein